MFNLAWTVLTPIYVFKRLLILPLFLCASLAHSAAFEYELWMQAETSLDVGDISVAGKIVNTGTVALDLTSQIGIIAGIPSNLNDTTCSLFCLNTDLSGLTLSAGESLNINWLFGTQEEDLFNYAGEELHGSLGFIPLGSDWNWTAGGYIPELLVSSLWVNGDTNTSQFNKTVINLDVAGQYMNYSELSSVPVPAAVWLFGSALLGLFGFNQRNKEVEV